MSKKDRRRLLGRKRSGIVPGNISFDTLNSENPTSDAFLIKRESDNAEQTFTYSQLTDGTYASFISGTSGKIIEWLGANNARLIGAGTMNLTTAPLVDNTLSNGSYLANHNLTLDNDYIITVVMGWVANTLGSRSNWVIRGIEGKSLFIWLRSDNIYIYLDIIPPNQESITPTYLSSHTINNVPRLYTFSKINGVFQLRVNNVLRSLTPNPTQSWRIGNPGDSPVNSLKIGGFELPDNYKHYAAIEGEEATTKDISAYNQAIMTKYGI